MDHHANASPRPNEQWIELDAFVAGLVRDRCGGEEHVACLFEFSPCGTQRCRSAMCSLSSVALWLDDMRELARLLGGCVWIAAEAVDLDGPYLFSNGDQSTTLRYEEALRLLISVEEARSLEHSAAVHSKAAPPSVRRL